MKATKNEYLAIARNEAQKGNCKRRNYGCVIVDREDVLITWGHTYSEGGCTKCKRRFARKGHGYDKCTSLHAEQMCIAKATHVPPGTIAYLACFDSKTGNEVRDPHPCPTCARLLKYAGVKRVVTATEEIEL